MRIASSNAYETSISNLQKRQAALTDSQERLTSGKRVLRASDDPAAAAVAERALAVQQRSDAQLRALNASRNAMALSESALGNAGEMVAQARDLLVSAGNGSYGDSERRAIADSIRGLRNDLLAVANRQDGAGRYLFGGLGSNTPPLVDAPGGVAYVGTAGQLQAAVGSATPLSIDGRSAWLEAEDPASPGTTVSLFDAMDRVIEELDTPGRSSSDIAATVSRGLGEFDIASDQLASWRSRAGESLNRLDGLEQRVQQAKLDAQTERSEAEDLDLLAAISDFQNRQTGYDAALKTYSIVQQMSLFEYLR
ncbi:MAG: flagellar hook-associated protein FlgL [Rubrivivax sp.]|nr:flagellar hook-associated protein FlgL [Rubrivivax sp.]